MCLSPSRNQGRGRSRRKRKREDLNIPILSGKERSSSLRDGALDAGALEDDIVVVEGLLNEVVRVTIFVVVS